MHLLKFQYSGIRFSVGWIVSYPLITRAGQIIDIMLILYQNKYVSTEIINPL